jgi:uncharacterized phage protein (TIGR02216 family)
MEMGLGRLARSPNEFWAMTPKELAAAITGAVGLAPASLSRAALDELMSRFPDPAPKKD